MVEKFAVIATIGMPQWVLMPVCPNIPRTTVKREAAKQTATAELMVKARSSKTQP